MDTSKVLTFTYSGLCPEAQTIKKPYHFENLDRRFLKDPRGRVPGCWNRVSRTESRLPAGFSFGLSEFFFGWCVDEKFQNKVVAKPARLNSLSLLLGGHPSVASQLGTSLISPRLSVYGVTLTSLTIITRALRPLTG